MATYLQGVTDYIPDYQPFQPDLNFYGSVMQKKQTQYDSNWKSLNNLYADLHNADLTHDLNIKKKDDVLKQIDFNLKRVTGLDLSLQQNVDQATQVFRPFYEDKYLMKDMAWTKNYTTKLSNALNLKNSQDEKMRGQYWDTGIKDMQYRREEFKASTLEETLNMGNASYTPYVNAMEKYLKLAKDTGLSIDVKDIDASGMYFVREKNGKALMSPLQNLFMSAYINDPALQAVYSTQAYVKRKDYAEQYATKFNGNKDEAEKEYLRDQYKFLQNYAAKKNVESQETVTVTKSKTTETENAIQKGEANPYSESYLESLNKALTIDQTVADHTEKLDKDINGGASNTIATSSTSGDPNQLDLSDMTLARLRVDGSTASILAEQDIVGASEIYAYKDYVYEKSANPVGLENMRHQNAMARIDYTHKLKQDEMKLKADYDIEKTRIDQGLADGTIWYDKNGRLQEKDGSAYKAPFGSSSGLFTDEINVMKDNSNVYDKSVIDLTGDYIGTTLTYLKNLADGKNSNGKPLISNKEIWSALSFLDPTSKDAINKYGKNMDGRKLLAKMYQDYQNDGDKFIINFSKYQVVKLKKFMDGWSNTNFGNPIAVQYKNNPSLQGVEQYKRYRDQMSIINKENQTKINKSLVKTLSSNEDYAWLKPETKAKIADVYNKYNKTHNTFNYDEFAVLIDKELGYKTEYKRWSASGTSTAQTNVSAGSGTSPVSSFSKKSGIDLRELYENLSGGYLTAVNQTGSEGLKSYRGIVRTPGGRYSLGAGDITVKDVILSNPSFGGFQDFQEIMSDIKRIRFSQDPNNYAVTAGLGKTATELPVSTVKNLLYELQMSAGTKNKTAAFQIGRSAAARENANLGAVIIRPPQAILEKYFTIMEDGKKVPDWTTIAEINNNGINFIAPKNQWTNNFFLENESSPTEQILNASGASIKYTQGNGAGTFTMEKLTNVPGADYRVSYQGYALKPDGTTSEISDGLNIQRSGNKIEDSEDYVFNLLQEIDRNNQEVFKQIQKSGNKEALQNANKFFAIPVQGGYKY